MGRPRFQVESLEQRILLSADGFLGTLAASQSGIFDTVEVAWATEPMQLSVVDPAGEGIRDGRPGTLFAEAQGELYFAPAVAETEAATGREADADVGAAAAVAVDFIEVERVSPAESDQLASPVGARAPGSAQTDMTRDLTASLLAAHAPPFLLVRAEAAPSSGGGEISVSGTVTSAATSSALSGILVRAYPAENPLEPVAEATTNASGLYNLTWSGAGDFIFQFTDPSGLHFSEFLGGHPQYEGATVHSLAAGGSLSGADISLDPAGRITGTVTRSSDGTPVEGARVGVMIEWMMVAETRTDAGGNYVLGQLLGTSLFDYTVAVDGSAAGLGQAQIQPVSVATGSTTAGVDAVLNQRAMITGTVTDLSGTPLAGVEVILRDYDDQWSWIASARTEADGSYVLGGLLPGDYKVQFRNGHFGTWHGGTDFAGATVVTVSDAATPVTIDASIERGATVTGRVTSPSGVGLPRVEVEAVAHDAQWNTFGSAYTDESGDYVMQGLPAGDFKFRFMGYAIGFDNSFHGAVEFSGATVVSVAAGATVGGIDGTLNRKATVYGRVTMAATGEGLPFAEIRVMDAFDSWSWTGDAMADMRGYYVARGVEAGDSKIMARENYGTGFGLAPVYHEGKSNFESADVVVIVAGANHEYNFALSAGGAIVGRILDPEGNPVQGVWVDVYSADVEWDYITDSWTNADGNFVI